MPTLDNMGPTVLDLHSVTLKCPNWEVAALPLQRRKPTAKGQEDFTWIATHGAHPQTVPAICCYLYYKYCANRPRYLSSRQGQETLPDGCPQGKQTAIHEDPRQEEPPNRDAYWQYFRVIEGDHSTKPRNVVHRRRRRDPYGSSSDDERSPPPKRATEVWEIPGDEWGPHLTYLDPHGKGLQSGTRPMQVGGLTIYGRAAQLLSRELSELGTLLHPPWHTADFPKIDQTTWFNFETLDRPGVQVVPSPQEDVSLNNPEDWDLYSTDDEDFCWIWVLFVTQTADVEHQDVEIGVRVSNQDSARPLCEQVARFLGTIVEEVTFSVYQAGEQKIINTDKYKAHLFCRKQDNTPQ